MSKLLSEVSRLMNAGGEITVSVRVEDVMTREVVTIAPDHSFQEAITLIARHRFRHLLVTDAERRLVGVLSDRDLLRFMIREPHWDAATVAEVIKSDPVTTVRAYTLLSAAITEMLSRRINCLPVVDEEGRVEGILTSTDLLKAFQHVQKWIEQATRESQ